MTAEDVTEADVETVLEARKMEPVSAPGPLKALHKRAECAVLSRLVHGNAEIASGHFVDFKTERGVKSYPVCPQVARILTRMWTRRTIPKS